MGTEARGQEDRIHNANVVLELDRLWIAITQDEKGFAGVGPVIDRLNAASENLHTCGQTWIAERIEAFARQLNRAPLEQQPSVLKNAEQFVLYVLSAALEGRLLRGSDGIRSF